MNIHYVGFDELQLSTQLTTTTPSSDSYFANLMLDMYDVERIPARLRRPPTRYAPWKIELPEADLTIRSTGSARWSIETYVRQEPLQRDASGTYGAVHRAVLDVPKACPEVETASLYSTSVALCLDFSGGQFGRSSAARIRGPSRKKPEPTPNGFRFGKQFIAYNKSVEMREKPSKAYLKAIREAQGWSQERDGDLWRLEWQHGGKRLRMSAYPDMQALLLHDLERFELTRKVYGKKGRQETAPLWRAFKEQARVVVPWEHAPAVFTPPTDDLRTVNSKRGLVRHAAAWLGARLESRPRSAKEIFDAVCDRHFPLGSPQEDELLREFNLHRRRRGDGSQ